MSRISRRLGLAIVTLSALGSAARAADYDVTTIGEGADFKGCIATNAGSSLGVLAAGSTVALIAKPAGLAVAEGGRVAGTWAVDDGATVPIDSTADGANTVSLPVPNTSEAVRGLTTGRTLRMTVNGAGFTLPLGDMTQAFTALSECMATNQK